MELAFPQAIYCVEVVVAEGQYLQSVERAAQHELQTVQTVAVQIQHFKFGKVALDQGLCLLYPIAGQVQLDQLFESALGQILQLFQLILS